MVGTVKKSMDTVVLTMVAILLIPSPLLSSGGSHEPIQYHAPLLRITMRTLNIQRKLASRLEWVKFQVRASDSGTIAIMQGFPVSLEIPF